MFCAFEGFESCVVEQKLNSLTRPQKGVCLVLLANLCFSFEKPINDLVGKVIDLNMTKQPTSEWLWPDIVDILLDMDEFADCMSYCDGSSPSSVDQYC